MFKAWFVILVVNYCKISWEILCNYYWINIISDTNQYRYDCQHCKGFSSYLLNEIVDHCKTCTHMPRPNPYKCKFVCYMCDYSAYQVDPLRAHICAHSGEKPFKCSYCPFACARMSNLQAHMKTQQHMKNSSF